MIGDKLSEIKGRVGIYPYSQEVDPAFRHLGLIDKRFKVTAVASPRGWGYTGKRLLVNDNSRIEVSDNIQEIAEKIDCLLIPDFDVSEQIEIYIANEILKIVNQVAIIISSKKFSHKVLQILLNAPSVQSGDCKFLDLNNCLPESVYANLLKEKETELFDINVPIISICGVSEDTDKFEVSLSVREILLNEGYHVSQIGSRNCSELFGFHPFPDFMLNPSVDERKKVLLFNRYIYQLEKREKPDIFIITVPGGIQAINNKYTNGFGILAYCAYKAFLTDFLILCTFFGANKSDILQDLSQMCQFLFNASVDCFHMSNFWLDVLDSAFKHELVKLKVLIQDVQKELKEVENSDVPVITIYDEIGRKILKKCILSKLT